MTSSISPDTHRNETGATARAHGAWAFRKAGSGEYIADYSLHRWVHAPDAVVPELRWASQLEKARRWTDLTEVNAVRAVLLKAGLEVEVLAVDGQTGGALRAC